MTQSATLPEFWNDFQGYFYKFVRHHDLSKWCSAEHQTLQVSFKRNTAVMVIHASEAHKHAARRENQSAYFSQVSSNIWVVVLYFRVEDLGNIDVAEKEKLLAFFAALRQPAIIKETHFYITVDREKDQAMVQKVIKDVANYLKSKGRWAAACVCGCCGVSSREAEGGNSCYNCGGVFDYFKQKDLADSERDEADYYKNRGAPASDVSFNWLQVFSDGISSRCSTPYSACMLSGTRSALATAKLSAMVRVGL